MEVIDSVLKSTVFTGHISAVVMYINPIQDAIGESLMIGACCIEPSSYGSDVQMVECTV